jgi:hypothetical protein
MEEQPASESRDSGTPRRTSAEAFIKRLGKVLAAGAVGAFVYMLAFGPRNLVGASNGLFVTGAILLLIGLVPLVSEIFNRTTIASRLKDGNLDEVLKEQSQQVQQGQKLTFLFGLAGMLMVLVSFVLAFL